jgi:type IV pilus assembly protein PilM
MIFRRNKQQKRDAAIGIDLGMSQIKATVLQHHGDGLRLSQYAVRQLPIAAGKPGAEQQFAEQLQQLMNDLGVQERRACVSISCSSAMVCQAEFPRMPIEEVKSALKLNSSRYLRRDFSSYYLDAVELVEPQQDGKGRKSPQMKVLVGGAAKEEVTWYRNSLLMAKIRPEVIELAAVSVINAFRVSFPEICENEVVLLADIGARSTSLSFLRHGMPLITRIMHFGGAQVSDYVAQALTLDSNQAEEEKIKMTEPVQALVKAAISPLAREVRSSIDFFERQHECRVTRAYACGGSACSPQLLNSLSEEVGMHIECWDPIQRFDTSHFNGEAPRLASLAPSLAAAVGAAVAKL